MKKKFFKTIILLITLNFLVLEIGFVGLQVKAESNYNQIELENSENYFEDEYINEEGVPTKITYEIGEVIVVSQYENGELIGQSTANPNTDEVITISDDGETKSKISDTVTLMPDESIPGEFLPMGVGYYSMVSSKYSTAVSGCASFLAQLFEKTSTQYDQRYQIRVTKDQLLISIVASIVAAIFTRHPLTIAALRLSLKAFGIATSTQAVLESFRGTYQARKDIADYYVTAKNRTVFTNKITREYLILSDERTHQKYTVKLGETISAYGNPTSYSVMLNMGIINVANAGCK